MSSQLVVPPQRPLPRERMHRRKRHLVSEIAGPQKVPAAPRSRRRWLVTAAGVTAAAAAAAAFLGPDSTGEGTASAATVLRQAAVATRAQPAPPRPGPGEYLYVKSESAYLTVTVSREDQAYAVLVPRVRELWVGPDGGRMRETSGEPRFLSDRDRELWIAAGQPREQEVWTEAVEAPPALELPSNPDALYERLEAQSQGHPEGVHEEMFTLLADALRETMLRYLTATPAQRAALYEVAARIPGVELVGRVTDPVGRNGMAVAMTSGADGLRHMLVLDPDTGELLSEEQRVLDENEFGYPAGTRIGYATYVDVAIVDSDRERPRG